MASRLATRPMRTLLLSHVSLDRVLQCLRLRSADAVQHLLRLPKVEGGQRAHALRTHEFVRLRAAIAHHLQKSDVLVCFAELVKLRGDDLATAHTKKLSSPPQQASRPHSSAPRRTALSRRCQSLQKSAMRIGARCAPA
eukprot:CAMPEP_0119374400 /NCGR_PEP_ID=MMETSP1334-20130426/30573_1 /TAXON_ID=127549 /ORGANISM="Calcidiscus leptoporus, Strain RCC1130" /LENGTH=138 /DNA_ID=CAMNT_0007392459 /DNA_START=511 /DNA_END=926 /DNA_ORIENTATION=+